jgi:hypothetical protein
MEVDGAAAGRAKALRVGNQALAHRLDGVEVTSPFGADGAIEDWDAVEALWSHALTAQMRAKPTEHPLMLAEASDAVRAAREKMVELAFEKYNVPGGSRVQFLIYCLFYSFPSPNRSLDLDSNSNSGEFEPPPALHPLLLRSRLRRQERDALLLRGRAPDLARRRRRAREHRR